MTEFSPTAACAEFAAGLKFADIPPEAVDRMKRDLLDWLGCVIRGAADPAASTIRSVISVTGGAPQAGVPGEPGRTDVRSAAFMNAFFSHIMEMDDVDRPSISHPASCVIPPVLALAEYSGGKSGADILTAIVAGFEVMLRIGAAVTPGHYRVFHTTATAGGFGSAAACGRLLGLNPTRLTWALGNAGTIAGGLWQFNQDGAMSKFIHTGNAAANGLFTALLAGAGFSGPHRILEGSQGFFAGFARQEPIISVFEDFGKNWRSNGISFKPYPCCGHTHSPIDAGIALHRDLAGEKLASARLLTYGTAINIAGKRTPATGKEGKFSISYCVAHAIVHGAVNLKSFEAVALRDPEVLEVEKKITLVDDPEITACVSKRWPCRLEAVTESGRSIVEEIRSPTGDPDNDMDWEGVEEKFRTACDGILGEEAQQEIIGTARSLEKLPPSEAVRFFEIINS